MATITIIEGQTTYIDPQIQYADSGWVVDGVYATHYPCFAGTMEYTPTLPFQDGIMYDIEYVIDGYISGSVYSSLGATNGANRASNGDFTDTFTYHTGDKFKFYSDGSLRLKLLNIATHQTEQINNGQTFAFNEPNNIWVSDYSYLSEGILRYGNKLFSFSSGSLWEHGVNQVAGMFYGVKYPVQISIVVNKDYEVDKLWYNIRLDANGQWYAPILQTLPTNQFPNGMLSRLKKNNFSLVDGKLWSAILRDLNDPNFTTEANQAIVLYKARMLQSGVLIIEFECNDNAPADMSSCEVYYTDVNRTF